MKYVTTLFGILLVVILAGCTTKGSDAPVITMNNTFLTTYEVKSAEPNWLEAIEIQDDVDQNIEVTADMVDTSQVNMNQVGSFKVTYEVSDSHGEVSNKTIIIRIVDTKAPVITGMKDITVGYRLSIDYFKGVSVFDEGDGEIDLTMDHIDTSQLNKEKLGTYPVTYRVSDSSGNTVEETILVTIVDTRPPVINAPNTITLPYGYTTQDIMDQIWVSDNYDRMTLREEHLDFTYMGTSRGIHELKVFVRDSSGNLAIKTIEVIVK